MDRRWKHIWESYGIIRKVIFKTGTEMPQDESDLDRLLEYGRAEFEKRSRRGGGAKKMGVGLRHFKAIYNATDGFHSGQGIDSGISTSLPQQMR